MIVPVAAGLMRNDWYPKRKADYITGAHLRRTVSNEAPVVRNFNFRPDLAGNLSSGQDEMDDSSAIDVHVELLTVRCS